jgi:DNA-binding MarR family transcriptional regulator
VGEEPIALAELERRAGTPTNVDGMRRWGYIRVDPWPVPGARSKFRPGGAATVVATRRGLAAKRVCEPLGALVETRWRERFGAGEVDRLRGALTELMGRVDGELPDCLPILGFGLFTAGEGFASVEIRDGPLGDGREEPRPLWALLSRALILYAIAFERRSRVSLAISADVVRVLDEAPVALRELPALGGVSKEAVAMATGWLVRAGFAVIEPLPAPGRGRQIRLTDGGLKARSNYRRRCAAIDEAWRERLGADLVHGLRAALTALAGDGTPDGSPLFAGLTPDPDGWRATVPPPRVLPHFPMVLHRGGFPDGS